VNTQPPAPDRPGLAVLVAISTLQPFALNVLAPSTPALARAFDTDYATIQLTLGLFLLAIAVTQLVVGPVSDRVGRRPCVLAGMGLFVAGSIGGALAGDTASLLVARVVQAAGAGIGFALARAIVRDTSERDEAASRIGYLTMVMVVAPMIAPYIGGLIDERFGWRWIFGVKVAFGLCVWVFAYLSLNETAPPSRVMTSMTGMLRAFPLLLANRAFLGHVLAMAFTSAAFFALVAGAPYVVVEVMGQRPDVYGAYFMLNAGGYMAGNFLSGRYATRLGTDRMVALGTMISVAAVLVEALVVATTPWTPANLFIPLAFAALGNGLTLPGATAAALSVNPRAAGTSAGVAGALQLGLGAVVSFVVGATVSIWPPSLVLIMLVCVLAGFAGHRHGRAARR